MTQRNPLVEASEARETASSVDTDGSGDVTITVGSLRQIEDAADVSADAVGGYVANVQSVTDNQVTVRIFESAGTAAALSAVTGGSSVTDVQVKAIGQ